MSNVADFIKIREQIESRADNIGKLLAQGAVVEPKLMLDQASELLVKLTAMVDNDIQVTAAGRLTRLLGSLRKKVASLEKKKHVPRKSPSQNIASQKLTAPAENA